MRQLSSAQLNQLLDIDEVASISDEDCACLEEIREVLARHEKLSRFGIALLHKHFDLADDEILLEVCDEERRILVAKPAKRSEVSNDRIIQTIWRFDGVAGKTCSRFCQVDQFRRHVNKHSGLQT